ncbi:MAG TPA: dCTP deaminase [Thermoplasmata archaeon]|nr:dCTP deaminase [Thermoplasmata archaeon]
MPVLSDSDIVKLLSEGSLKIEGYDEKNLTPNGYDVTIEEILVPSTGKKHRQGIVSVPGNSWFVIGTREFLVLPPNLMGQIWIRTTWVRRGVLSSFGIIDAGFNGNLTFSAYNASKDPVEVPIGDRFAQVIFEELASPSKKSYGERSGNYQGQRGITLRPTKRR